MRIARRLTGTALLLLLGMSSIQLSPVMAAGVLQCVPYARAISGVRIHGDAWTWWEQAAGRYARGYEPRTGAVIALANTDVMPLGHVAVVSRIIDARHILLSHANWSAPGRVEQDVLAVDSSENNDWSQVRIWWGQTQQMGARDNPVNGFIYPDEPIRTERLGDPSERRMLMAMAPGLNAGPRLAVDNSLFVEEQDSVVTGTRPRSWASIVAEVQRGRQRP